MCNIVKESEARTSAITLTRMVDASSDYLRNAVRTLDPRHARECCGDIKRFVGEIETRLAVAFPVIDFDPIELGM